MEKYKILGIAKRDAYHQDRAIVERFKDKILNEDQFDTLKQNNNENTYSAWIGNYFFIGLMLEEINETI